MKSFDVRNLAKAFDREGRDTAKNPKFELGRRVYSTNVRAFELPADSRLGKSPNSRIYVCLKAIFPLLDQTGNLSALDWIRDWEM